MLEILVKCENGAGIPGRTPGGIHMQSLIQDRSKSLEMKDSKDMKIPEKQIDHSHGLLHRAPQAFSN